jgi:hypothetical protein
MEMVEKPELMGVKLETVSTIAGVGEFLVTSDVSEETERVNQPACAALTLQKTPMLARAIVERSLDKSFGFMAVTITGVFTCIEG